MLRLAVGALLLIVVLGGLGAYLTRPRPAAAPRPPEGIVLGGSRLDCARDMAWSPSGGEIAVLGYLGDCPILQSFF